MANYVLIHGAYAGIASLGKVPQMLRDAGHNVLAATLPGLGTRQSELHVGITLSDHVEAVCEQIADAQYDRFILACHSYGGAVGTAVASRLGKNIDAICYFDAFVPEDGECLWDYYSEDERSWYINNQRYTPGLVDPIGTTGFKVVPNSIGDQPLLTFTEALTLSGDEKLIPSKHYVLATDWKRESPFPRFADKAKANPSWQYHEVHCNHFILEKMPEFSTDLLISLS